LAGCIRRTTQACGYFDGRCSFYKTDNELQSETLEWYYLYFDELPISRSKEGTSQFTPTIWEARLTVVE